MKTLRALLQKRWFLYSAILLAIGLLLAMALIVPMLVRGGASRITISPATTYVVGPLTADGRVDYFQAYNDYRRGDIAPEDNGTVLLLQALGPSVIEPEFRDQLYRLLEMPPLPATGDYYIDWMSAEHVVSCEALRTVPKELITQIDVMLSNGQPVPVTRLPQDVQDWIRDERLPQLDVPWRRSEHLAVAEWIELNAKAAETIVAATKRPSRWMPALRESDNDTLIMSSMDFSSKLRSVSQFLAARAMLRCGEGDLSGSVDDAVAATRLGNRHCGRGTMIEVLISIAIQNSGLQCIQNLVISGQLPDTLLLQLDTELAQLTNSSGLLDGLRVGERMAVLSEIEALARNPSSFGDIAGSGGARIPNFATMAIDWNRVMRLQNEAFDRFGELRQFEHPWDRLDAAKKLSEDISLTTNHRQLWRLATMRGRSDIFGNVLVAMMLPAVEAIVSADVRSDAMLRMTQVAIGLERHRLAKGSYPIQLADISPEHFSGSTLDPFSGQPLRYRITEKGYILYSVGIDRVDNQGNSSDDQDMVIRVPVEVEVPDAVDTEQDYDGVR